MDFSLVYSSQHPSYIFLKLTPHLSYVLHVNTLNLNNRVVNIFNRLTISVFEFLEKS